MCLRAMSGGVRRARWTQIGAISRANMPWRPLEWRLPCQMNCRKAMERALTELLRPCVAGRRPSSKSSREPMCPRAMSGVDRGQMIFRRARVRDLHLRRPCRNARLPLEFAYLGIKIFSCLEDITDAADQRFVVESGAVGESAVRDVEEAVAVAGAEAVVSK